MGERADMATNRGRGGRVGRVRGVGRVGHGVRVGEGNRRTLAGASGARLAPARGASQIGNGHAKRWGSLRPDHDPAMKERNVIDAVFVCTCDVRARWRCGDASQTFQERSARYNAPGK